MDEGITTAIIRLNKTKALCRVEPFNHTGVQFEPLS